MWYWQCSPFWGLWWIFPLMFIFCMVLMFFVMRAFLGGRFPCGCMRNMMDRAGDAGRYGGREESHKSAPGEGGR